MKVNVRQITVGSVHELPGDPTKVVVYYGHLRHDDTFEFPPIVVHEKPNGTYRIWDGRHRFLAYVLAERDTIPVEVRRLEDLLGKANHS